MRLKQIAAALGVALALAITATAAQAATYNLAGNLVADNALGAIKTAAQTFFVDVAPTGASNETFSFSTGSASSAFLTIASYFSGTTADVPDVSFDLTPTSGGSTIFATAIANADLDNQGVTYGYTFSSLTANTAYSLTVHVSEVASLGDKYTLQIAAVPEPESYAMLLAGLGLMVSVARRRKSTVVGS